VGRGGPLQYEMRLGAGGMRPGRNAFGAGRERAGGGVTIAAVDGWVGAIEKRRLGLQWPKSM
jgi:hypothetical protein